MLVINLQIVIIKRENSNFHVSCVKVIIPVTFCPLLDEASKELENLTTSQPCLSVGYQKISHDPPLVDLVIDQKPSLVNPALFESESRESILNQPLVEKTIDLAPPLVKCTFLVESEPHTTQVLLVSSVSNELEGNPPIYEVHERSSHIPIALEGSSHTPTPPSPSSLVTLFDWSRLAGYPLALCSFLDCSTCLQYGHT